MTEIETYIDPIISLVRDPNLNKERAKVDQLVHIINGFPLSERRISKLCTVSLQILKDLERIELKTRSWAFLSLDYNSQSHFIEENPLKKFNNDLAKNVLSICQELHKILYEISIELDTITNSIQYLSPLEYISDSGTLLTQLCLRNIKLKNDLSDTVSVAYSKSKLINMGTDLEEILTTVGGNEQELSTIQSYKVFVGTLLKQLNTAVEQNDQATKNECMAVVTDVEKMFDAYKLEKAQDYESSDEEYEDDDVLGNLDDSFVHVGEYPTTPSMYMKKHSRKSSPSEDSLYDLHDEERLVNRRMRRGSLSSVSTSSTLQRTTITDELPYLLNAFDTAKTMEDEMTAALNGSEILSPRSSQTFKHPSESMKRSSILSERKPVGRDTPQHTPRSKNDSPPRSYEEHNFHYQDSNPLYQPAIINPSLIRQPSVYNPDNSLLGKLGIKPQIITAPKSTFVNAGIQLNRQVVYNNALAKKKPNMFPLTKVNLNSMDNEYKKKSEEVKYIDIDDYVE